MQLFPESTIQIANFLSTLPELPSLDSYGNHRPLNHNGAPHVTLLFIGKREKDLSPSNLKLAVELQFQEGLEVEVVATDLLYNEKGICFAVHIPSELADDDRRRFLNKNSSLPSHHITIATRADVPAKYSNDLMESLFLQNNNPENVKVVHLSTPLRFNSKLTGFA